MVFVCEVRFNLHSKKLPFFADREKRAMPVSVTSPSITSAGRGEQENASKSQNFQSIVTGNHASMRQFLLNLKSSMVLT